MTEGLEFRNYLDRIDAVIYDDNDTDNNNNSTGVSDAEEKPERDDEILDLHNRGGNDSNIDK